MRKKVEYLKDIFDQNYLAVIFSESEIKSYIDKFRRYINDDDYFKILNDNKLSREKEYHMTIINPIEYKKLVHYGNIDMLDRVYNTDLYDVKLKGIGKAERNDNISFFIVAESITADEMRGILGLDRKDLHITLGFDTNDVHGVRKDIIIKDIPTDFENALNIEYSKSGGSHKWLKSIENWVENLDFDDDDVEIINKSDSIIHYRIREYYITISLVDDKLRVTSFYDKL